MTAEQLENRRLLVDGVQALLAGRREQARDLLLNYLEREERDPEGWLWISGTIDDSSDIETALQNCLDCDPNNQYAKQGLQWINQHSRY